MKRLALLPLVLVLMGAAVGSAGTWVFRVRSDQTAASTPVAEFKNAAGVTVASVDIEGDVAARNLVGTGTATLDHVQSPAQWDDLSGGVTSLKVAGVKDPAWVKMIDNGAGSAGVYTWEFSASAEKELFFVIQFPHSRKNGTAVSPHLHWAPVGTGAGNVVWGIEYSVASINGTFGTTVVDEVTLASPGVTLKHTIAEFLDVADPGWSLSTVVVGRVYRKAADAADTYAGVAYLVGIDWHIQRDTVGSTLEYSKP